jgi:predicted enzyme related to lactoylglutathione lyase
MGSELVALSIDANDPERQARFWGAFLGWERADDADASAVAGHGPAIQPADETGFRIHFPPTDEPKVGQNWLHFDLTSESLDDQRRKVARALELGGSHLDIGQDPDDGHVVLADPEGNELCVIEPGNTFLAGCPFIGALSCDGSQAVGYFWSEALGWPLVWDQDEETAIQSPHGGPKIAWGGPPVNPRLGRKGIHLDLAVAGGSDVQDEVDRLVALGAARVPGTGSDGGAVVLKDPDGNAFCLLPSRGGRS